MSTKEKCISILDSFSEAQLVNVLSILQAAQNAIEEAEDEAFCASLYEDYLNSEKEEAVPIESLAAELGIAL